MNRPMRVLVVTAMYPTPSDPVLGIVVRREVELLRRAGVEVHVVDKTPGARGYAGQVARAVRDARGVDLVHAHYGTAGFAALPSTLRRPLVVTMHGSDIALGPRPRLDKYWVQYLLSVAGAARSRRVIVQSPEMAAGLPSRLQRRAVVLGQPVALPGRPCPGDTDRAGVLFLSSRHRAVKRVDRAEAAFARLRSPLALRGPELGTLDRHPPHLVRSVMRSARVGVLTSDREGLPVAVKEALAEALPVVSVDLPSLRPLARRLRQDVPGALHLVPPEDPSALAAAVDAALAAPALTAHQRDLLHTVLQEHGWTEEDHARAVQEVYSAALGQRGRAGDGTPRP